jgi:hypothetical protein
MIACIALVVIWVIGGFMVWLFVHAASERRGRG